MQRHSLANAGWSTRQLLRGCPRKHRGHAARLGKKSLQIEQLERREVLSSSSVFDLPQYQTTNLLVGGGDDTTGIAVMGTTYGTTDSFQELFEPYPKKEIFGPFPRSTAWCQTFLPRLGADPQNLTRDLRPLAMARESPGSGKPEAKR